MKVDLDARTLEAMRVLTARYNAGDPDAARDTLRAFLAAHDSARDAERDEALAVAIVNAANRVNGCCTFSRLCDMPNPTAALAQARAARDFIAKEQVNTQQPRTENPNG